MNFWPFLSTLKILKIFAFFENFRIFTFSQIQLNCKKKWPKIEKKFFFEKFKKNPFNRSVYGADPIQAPFCRYVRIIDRKNYP